MKSVADVNVPIESKDMSRESAAEVKKTASHALPPMERSEMTSEVTKQPESKTAHVTIELNNGTAFDGRIKKKTKEDKAVSAHQISVLPTTQTYSTSSSAELFSVEGLLSHSDWYPSDLHPAVFALPNFNPQPSSTSSSSSSSSSCSSSSAFPLPTSAQTLALLLTVYPDKPKSRWSLNISPAGRRDCADLLLHFNPRYEKGELTMNDMQGTWGAAVKLKLAGRLSVLRSVSLRLVVQVRLEGFYVFANDTFVALFPHRRNVYAFGPDLLLELPATDSMGELEQIVMHKVWWGRVEESALPRSVPVPVPAPGVQAFDNYLARTVLVAGLPFETDPLEVYELEKALYTVFEAHTTETIFIVGEKGVAYVRLASPELVQHAVVELEGSMIADFTLHMSSIVYNENHYHLIV